MAYGNPGSPPMYGPITTEPPDGWLCSFQRGLFFLMSLHLKSLSLQPLFLQPLLKALDEDPGERANAARPKDHCSICEEALFLSLQVAPVQSQERKGDRVAWRS